MSVRPNETTLLPLKNFREIDLKCFQESAGEIQGSLISERKTSILHQ
jgi:hypothetical protein